MNNDPRGFRPVRMAQMNEVPYRFHPEGYRVFRNNSGPWLRRWLIRKMWQWLNNCGALEPYWHTETVYEYGKRERDLVSARVAEVVNNLLAERAYDPSFDPGDFAVCLGAKDFHEIMGGYAQRGGGLTINGGDFCIRRQGGYEARIDDLPVRVIPEMEGAIVIPRVIVEKERTKALK